MGVAYTFVNGKQIKHKIMENHHYTSPLGLHHFLQSRAWQKKVFPLVSGFEFKKCKVEPS